LTLEGDDETFSLVVALDAFWGADSSCPRIVVEDGVASLAYVSAMTTR